MLELGFFSSNCPPPPRASTLACHRRPITAPGWLLGGQETLSILGRRRRWRGGGEKLGSGAAAMAWSGVLQFVEVLQSCYSEVSDDGRPNSSGCSARCQGLAIRSKQAQVAHGASGGDCRRQGKEPGQRSNLFPPSTPRSALRTTSCTLPARFLMPLICSHALMVPC